MPDQERRTSIPHPPEKQSGHREDPDAVATRAAAQLGSLAGEFTVDATRVDDPRIEALLNSTAHLLSVLEEAFSDARKRRCRVEQGTLSPRTDVPE